MAEEPNNNQELKEEVEVTKKERSDSPLLKDNKTGLESSEIEQIVVTEHSFWDKLALLRLSVEEKATVVEAILDEIQNNALYWLMLILSLVIITFGLLQSSVAVVIGGMLIAPILKPIKGLAFSITTGQPRYFWRSAAMLFSSIVVAIFTAYLFSLITPLKVETPEIISRTSPTILDLFIAIASGTIAMLSLYFKRLSESIAGVAMAASLMPPLAVVGIEMSLMNPTAVAGSSFLFITNLFAILAIGVIVFLLYGFSPHHTDTKNISVRVGAILFALLLYISFPLYTSLRSISDRIEIQTEVTESIENSLAEAVPGTKFSNLQIEYLDDQSAKMSGTLKLQEGVSFDNLHKEFIYTRLREALNREVEMELDIVPVVYLGGE